MQQLLDRLVTVPGQYDMCATCRRYIMKREVPPSAVVKGFRYPPLPPGLRPLTEVEEHVLALRLPFQQIVHLGTMGQRGQYGVRGSVINVPTEPDQTVRTIVPLLPEEDELCVVNIKRKLVHKRAFARSFVRKDKIIQWGRFLEKSTLYREHGAKFEESRLDELPGDQDSELRSNQGGEVFYGEPDEPDGYTDMHDRLGTIQSTLLMEDRAAVPPAPAPAPALAEPSTSRANAETDEIDLAPGEDKIPVSVVWDRKAEELSFPGIYLGEPRTFTGHVTRFQAMRSEIRRVDRRGARPQSLLYKYNLHAREQAAGRLRHKFKRGAKDVLGKDITKEQLLNPAFVSSSLKKGLAMPSLLPNSAEYWRGRGHDLLAAIRQLGRPHLFLTLSSAEYHSPILIKVLQRLHREHAEMDRFATAPPSAVGAAAMEAIDDVMQQGDLDEGRVSSEEKLRLIREDPVVCASYFREIVLQLKKYLRMKKNGPMGQYFVKDWFTRIEFQQRGSPHAHCLLWVNDGPDEPLKDLPATIAFIDALITCDSSHPLAERNKHHHTSTCYKNKHIRHRFVTKRLTDQEKHRHCRFGAPYFPTPTTRIVFPLRAEEDERREEDRGDMDWPTYIEYLRELRLKLKDVLAAKDCPDTLAGVWKAARCPDDATYELAIRTGVRRPQVLYKRAVVDRWTNPHLDWQLQAFLANGDFQIILDVYSLANYCVGYVTKAEKNHSQLHNEIIRLRRDHGFDDRTLMRMLCSRTLRAKETSAQEAAWVLMKFPLCETSRKCTFIDTSPPEERVHCPKPAKDIRNLPEGSTDLWYPDVYDVYSRRPAELEQVTLAQFVALHHQSKDLKARRSHRIIRYRRYAEKSEDEAERENFYRSMCTLHLSWRDEQTEILQVGRESSFQNLYATNEDTILARRKVFEAVLGLDTTLAGELEACIADEEAEALEADCNARGMLAGNSKLFFDEEAVAEFMDCDDAQNVDIDLPGSSRPQQAVVPAQVRRRGVWDRQTFLDQIRRLNDKQREVVLAVIHDVRTQAKPRLIYIDGAAGTGKSVVARNLANAFETFCPANSNEDSSRVVISAPTGKAAFNIGGGTLHHNYHLSYNQEATATRRLHDGADVMLPLQGQQLGNLQNAFANVQAQIIDEVSMMSDRNFLAVDQRCKEAKSSEVDMGNLWTIIFGDFRQLVPVGGAPVYASSTDSIAGSALLWQKFEYVELTQNMRQGEDKVFAELLTRIGDAEGPLSDADRALIESRFVAENNLTVPRGCPRLYHCNEDKDAFNLHEILKSPSHCIIRLFARDRVQENKNLQGLSVCRRRKLLEKHDDLLERAKVLPTTKAKGLPHLLMAVAGHYYKLTVNINVPDGLCNGSVGVLEWVQVGVLCPQSRTPGVTTTELAVQTLWLRFPGEVGAATSRAAQLQLRAAIERQKSLPQDLVDALPFQLPACPEEDKLAGLVPVEREDRHLNQLRTEQWRHVYRQQFPLVPSLAETIHASQGGSYDKACVEYYDQMQNNMVYVGLSRVRTLAGLFINNTNGKRLRRVKSGRVQRRPAPRGSSRLFNHPRVDKKDQRLAKEKQRLRSKPFVPQWAALVQRPATGLRLVYHNVQSLIAHQQDVVLDKAFMQADVLLLAETWVRPGQPMDLGHGLHMVARCDAPAGQGNAAGGVAVYSRLPLCQERVVDTLPLVEAVSARQGDELLVAVLYCHPGAKQDHILEAFGAVLPSDPAQTTVLAADFNVDLQSAAGRRISEALKARGLTNSNDLSEPTTYNGTTIDGVYSNAASMSVGRYQSYFSVHIPLIIDIARDGALRV
ncbi:uncharacterized protein LOC113211074 [Frankliniella occidentalis]|uniref:ATP-dependent DNA helicase n=1 Tax=Frankliniella occidentalis TaxID=133901 RepID=A0A6J1SW24_FRAOC|nr:uncharacterized protein LOC113211074 [Frankliniella occidentalis]